ncbi:hypothetical protein [Faucicola boevrei]|uniref:hypothetical protein n=1 Tax=Faucicola boevrei TaxID=346665 RepID=UPI00036BE075|nr:hypothetical protein [Moraxella boevrei]
MLKFLLLSCLLFTNIAFANSVFVEISDDKGDDKSVGIITANGKTIIPMQYQKIIQNKAMPFLSAIKIKTCKALSIKTDIL